MTSRPVILVLRFAKRSNIIPGCSTVAPSVVASIPTRLSWAVIAVSTLLAPSNPASTPKTLTSIAVLPAADPAVTFGLLQDPCTLMGVIVGTEPPTAFASGNRLGSLKGASSLSWNDPTRALGLVPCCRTETEIAPALGYSAPHPAALSCMGGKGASFGRSVLLAAKVRNEGVQPLSSEAERILHERFCSLTHNASTYALSSASQLYPVEFARDRTHR
eukprot:3933031-Rhodomonas_salina.1